MIFFLHTTIVTVCVFVCVCHVFSYNPFYFDFHSARITDSKSCQITESVLKYKNGFKNNLMYKEIFNWPFFENSNRHMNEGLTLLIAISENL